jgi:hypothetical protein
MDIKFIIFPSLLSPIVHMHNNHQYPYIIKCWRHPSMVIPTLSNLPQNHVFIPLGRPSSYYFLVLKPSHIKIPYVKDSHFLFHELWTQFANISMLVPFVGHWACPVRTQSFTGNKMKYFHCVENTMVSPCRDQDNISNGLSCAWLWVHMTSLWRLQTSHLLLNGQNP